MASPAGDPLETALDELYGSDPSDFVALRKQLAARLRGEGERDAAKAVLAARRPTAAAGALNQLAREQPEVITDLLERSNELRDSFSVSRDDVRAATAAHRDALRAVTDAALAVVGGRSDSARSQIQATLHAAGIDTEVARLLRMGRLEKEMTGPSGFGETELPEFPATDDRPAAPPQRHLRLAPVLDPADATATDAPLSRSGDEAAEAADRERAAAEQAAHEAAERERQERERIDAAAREQRRAELQAVLAAAEVEATQAGTELEAARQVERDLEAQLQGAHDRRARAEAQARATRATVAELRATLDLEAAGDTRNEGPTV